MKDIKILISCHKESDIPKSNVMLPIQVGTACSSKKLEYMLHDDEGDHISDKNKSYCELTAQYWAWKNLKADYYGFCHYRRYFNFSSNKFREDCWGNIIDDFIDETAAKLYGFDDSNIINLVEQYDIITTERKDLRKMPTRFKSVYHQYEMANDLHYKDLLYIREIIHDISPEYDVYADRHLQGHTTSFCNMYILKKELFFTYCEWLFRVLSEFERRCDMSHYSKEALRTPGHLAERLFGIFYLAILDKNPDLKVKELQCVLFEYPEKHEMLTPKFTENSVPIVLASDNYFLPMAATCIQSIIECSNKNTNYDLVILEADITKENKNLLLSMVSSYSNFSIRFYNVTFLLSGYTLKANAHISVETYYRFLIQSILPQEDKVIYLDSDTIVLHDLADLYSIPLDGYQLAAVLDPDFIGQINGANPDTSSYCNKQLDLKNPYRYFQAGVLLLNTKEMRNSHSLNEWLTFASKEYKYNDQDVLNIHCQGGVKFIDMSWNVLTDCAHSRIKDVIRFAPNSLYEDYMRSRLCPKIVHFAGYLKPWHRPDEDFAWLFWKYAKNTLFYETLLFRMCEGNAWHVANNLDKSHHVSQKLTSSFVNSVTFLFPKGSKRRLLVKRILYSLKFVR